MPVLSAAGGGDCRFWAVLVPPGGSPQAPLSALRLPARALVLPARLLAGSFSAVPLPAHRGRSRLPGLESSVHGVV